MITRKRTRRDGEWSPALYDNGAAAGVGCSVTRESRASDVVNARRKIEIKEIRRAAARGQRISRIVRES